jgi:dihydroorotase
VDPATGRDEIGDLFIEGGIILPSITSGRSVRVIDAKGLVVTPGFIDLHVHFRDPGNPEAETFESGSESAAAGGFTTVVAMPNTTPPMDTADRITAAVRRAHQVRFTRVLPCACLTRDRAGKELADLPALAKAGAAAFSDDGTTVPDESLMEQAMRTAASLRRPIMDHAQDPRLAGKGVMREGAAARRLGLPGIPPEAEITIVDRDIRLAASTGCTVHIQHVSSRESIDLIRQARARGLPVSGEATPHHLALTEADVRADNPDFKMNPPLGDSADREALLAAVADGTLEAFATDHAPHRAADKAKGFLAAPFGIIGLETAVGVTYTELVKAGIMGLADWIRRWTAGPARILGMSPPSLAPGQPADIVLLDLAHEWTVTPQGFCSRSRNSPFIGRTLTGRAARTICGGRVTWNGRC